MKRSFFMLLALLLATQVTFAQKEGFKHQKANPQFQKEMSAYIETNVQPVLLKAQQGFDQQLSEEDLRFIKEKREQAKARKADMKDNRQKAMELRKEGKSKEEIQEALEIDWEASKEAHQAERAAIKAFMERNQNAVKSSMESLKPSYEQWIKDQKAIVQKYRPADKAGQEKPDEEMKGKRGSRIGLFGIAPPKHFRHGSKGHEKMDGSERMNPKEGAKRGDHGKKHAKNKEGVQHHDPKARLAVEFVLWDGTLPEVREGRPAMEGKSLDNRNDIFALQNYPNPANGITKITAQLPTEVKIVKIVVRDASGKTVKNLLFKNVDKGTTTFDLDVSNLTDGLYFYTFDADGQTTTKRLVVGK